MKKCSLCGVEKPLFEFNKHKNRKDGHQTACRICNKNYVIKHYYNNQDQIAEQRKQKYPGVQKRRLEYGKTHYENNKAQYFARSAIRRSTKLQRTPPWLSEECALEIKTLYTRAQLIKQFTGEIWHVDHIVPLKGKKVSGLHVPWNLQLLPAEENLSKANKFTP